MHHPRIDADYGVFGDEFAAKRHPSFGNEPFENESGGRVDAQGLVDDCRASRGDGFSWRDEYTLAWDYSQIFQLRGFRIGDWAGNMSGFFSSKHLPNELLVDTPVVAKVVEYGAEDNRRGVRSSYTAASQPAPVQYFIRAVRKIHIGCCQADDLAEGQLVRGLFMHFKEAGKNIALPPRVFTTFFDQPDCELNDALFLDTRLAK